MLAKATAPAPGECAIVLAADALVPVELGELGVWEAFAAQADAVLAREGLARFHERSPIAEGADHVPDPLTVESDGALAFGVRSAPLGDDGDAVRRFAIVDRGIAAGLGLSPREAALRKRDPNGGVRNLVVPPGTWDGRVDVSGCTIEVRRLRELSIDCFTGDASLEIALAVEHGKGPFAGGTIRLDLVAALARARRSSERMRARRLRRAVVGVDSLARRATCLGADQCGVAQRACAPAGANSHVCPSKLHSPQSNVSGHALHGS